MLCLHIFEIKSFSDIVLIYVGDEDGSYKTAE